jgi:uncharacterized protein (DUF58 family)
MKFAQTPLKWLETHAAVPAYGGWVLMGLTFCFWLAATNTMAGWLYVLSGLGVALLMVSAIMPMQMLKGLEIRRSPLSPVQVGDPLFVEIHIRNRTTQAKGLLMVQDRVPQGLGEQAEVVIEAIAPHQESAPQSQYTWQYSLHPERRGLYQWQTVTLRTGAPLGLFWSRRVQKVQARVLIYPRVLPLSRCPLLEEIGPSTHQQFQQVPLSRTGSEGSTRSLRPYRTGDPMRMVHWRSSARFNALRVRELEVIGGGRTFVIALDTQSNWHPDAFEQAVMAAASLVIYTTQKQYAPQLWTSQWGLVQGTQQILEVLAQIEPQPTTAKQLPDQPAIWLTAYAEGIAQLPLGSRYILWTQPTTSGSSASDRSNTTESNHQQLGISINPEVPLQIQLQKSLQRP